jgi:hypothetical protein
MLPSSVLVCFLLVATGTQARTVVTTENELDDRKFFNKATIVERPSTTEIFTEATTILTTEATTEEATTEATTAAITIETSTLAAIVSTEIFLTTDATTTIAADTVTFATATIAPVLIVEEQALTTEAPLNASSWIENSTIFDSPLVQFFTKVVLNEVIGARYCNSDSDCGTGLACNNFFNLCAPPTTEIFNAFENATCALDTQCSDLHFCLGGSCRFCGPTTCLTNLDCCSGLASNLTFECVNLEHLEKHSLTIQLGRPMFQGSQNNHHHHEDHSLESEEIETFGPTAQGDHMFHHKRCWARCAVDEDCIFSGFPLALQGTFNCCHGFCTRKDSCVSLPANFVAPVQIPANRTCSKKTKAFRKKF